MPSPAQDAIKASAGGLFALCALYPLDLLRTKRAAESSTSNENSKKKSRDHFSRKIPYKITQIEESIAPIVNSHAARAPRSTIPRVRNVGFERSVVHDQRAVVDDSTRAVRHTVAQDDVGKFDCIHGLDFDNRPVVACNNFRAQFHYKNTCHIQIKLLALSDSSE